MAKFPINPGPYLYSGDNCYVKIAAIIVISQSSYSLLNWGLYDIYDVLFFIGLMYRIISQYSPISWYVSLLQPPGRRARFSPSKVDRRHTALSENVES